MDSCRIKRLEDQEKPAANDGGGGDARGAPDQAAPEGEEGPAG